MAIIPSEELSTFLKSTAERWPTLSFPSDYLTLRNIKDAWRLNKGAFTDSSQLIDKGIKIMGNMASNIQMAERFLIIGYGLAKRFGDAAIISGQDIKNQFWPDELAIREEMPPNKSVKEVIAENEQALAQHYKIAGLTKGSYTLDSLLGEIKHQAETLDIGR